MLAVASVSGAKAAAARPDVASLETVVFVRHAEKLPGRSGQLSCQGLNRALALPKVIATKFGRPDAIFALNPASPKTDEGLPYARVRSLATIEPAAVRFGLQVYAYVGIGQPGQLVAALDRPAFRGALVIVSWEHDEIAQIAKALLSANGADADQVERWPSDDFDSIYVVRVRRAAGGSSATFEHDREGLDGQPAACPG